MAALSTLEADNDIISTDGFIGFPDAIDEIDPPIVKEEPILLRGDTTEIDCIGSGGGGGGGGGLCFSSEVPKPMEGLNEQGPPPFLKKTLAMVDDPSTDSIISWSESHLSFIVWDHHKFSTDILPKHFKHRNFTSFVRQLNTYGFKKIDSDRWEYANEGFQKGKNHLLKSIKRKQQHSDCQALQNQKFSQLSFDRVKLRKEAELEKLRNDNNTLKMEILKIQKQQEHADNHLSSIKERLRNTENTQKMMMMFMAKALRNPKFVEIIKQLGRKKAQNISGIAKKQRLVAPQVNKSSNDAAGNTENDNHVQDEFATIESEIRTLFSPDETRSPVNEDQKANENAEMKSTDVNSENYILWEKLLEDSMVFEYEATREQEKIRSNIVLELEELLLGCLHDIGGVAAVYGNQGPDFCIAGK